MKILRAHQVRLAHREPGIFGTGHLFQINFKLLFFDYFLFYERVEINETHQTSSHQNFRSWCHDVAYYRPADHYTYFNSAFNEVELIYRFEWEKLPFMVRRVSLHIFAQNCSWYLILLPMLGNDLKISWPIFGNDGLLSKKLSRFFYSKLSGVKYSMNYCCNVLATIFVE